jgi:hypothetical protein
MGKDFLDYYLYSPHKAPIWIYNVFLHVNKEKPTKGKTDKIIKCTFHKKYNQLAKDTQLH